MIEQNRLGPTFPCPQHISVGEPTACSQALIMLQRNTSSDDITHVHIGRSESSPVKGCSHLDMAIYTLLSQNSNSWPRSTLNIRSSNIIVHIETQLHIQTRVGDIEYAIIFLLRTLWIIPQLLHLMSGL